ncbi:hypothetical protein AVEN_123815-1 [Araneus ventricosus]|uniref:Uncharacterized protein n=1 Tax=Araneus ventricosus TaxID=182803 RepID=A0A4Y2BK73_ARAVE|nr:hypothetical protein AVEN_123815-1 [Araneus ventricosus]
MYNAANSKGNAKSLFFNHYSRIANKLTVADKFLFGLNPYSGLRKQHASADCRYIRRGVKKLTDLHRSFKAKNVTEKNKVEQKVNIDYYCSLRFVLVRCHRDDDL